MSDIRYVTPRDPDGSWVEAQLTNEGVIVDRYDDSGLIGTFGQMYDEIVPPREEVGDVRERERSPRGDEA